MVVGYDAASTYPSSLRLGQVLIIFASHVLNREGNSQDRTWITPRLIKQLDNSHPTYPRIFRKHSKTISYNKE